MNDEEEPPLRIWIWQNVLHNYTDGMAIVVAADEEEARDVMKDQLPGFVVDALPFATAVELKNPSAFYVYGGQ